MSRRGMFKMFLTGLIPGATIKETTNGTAVILEVPESYDLAAEDVQHLLKEWAVVWKGAKNAPRLIILPPGCSKEKEGQT